MIEFRDVTKVYGSNDTHALENVNIKIEDGEFVFIVGSSGAGKSTFLKLIMHEEKPTSGEVIVNGYASTKMKKRQVPYYRRTMGIVFQDFRIIPKMSVYDNVAFARNQKKSAVHSSACRTQPKGTLNAKRIVGR